MNKEKLLFMASYSGGIWRAIGFFVIAPLIYNVYSYFANSGDTDNLQYLETYIGDSRIIRIELPTNIDQLDANFITSYRDRHRHLIYYFAASFYDTKQKISGIICWLPFVSTLFSESTRYQLACTIVEDTTGKTTLKGTEV
ncbi:hypothetical protein [Hoylesella pleuritidis]|uniref:Uncharacterized protein n=1 Tax=Hoylesella pleuritidis F0068 TaxID=1081904 RepID=U2KSC0_9BACT|nr:hypothetical protein [Hoylesella pleuritidis]ERK01387.1 hypothetical protein HMPREF1218_1623 [Hoylesella pleuritidis F0068]